ncbi:hypothetical protein LCGC14_1145830 [marine sediment metagenome]|uniref:Nuclease associated modular domain-containing protein n=1 Tax=marine sediment metagenome TaxID=412755 RepID=A0A0F9LWU8_9ZZZZ
MVFMMPTGVYPHKAPWNKGQKMLPEYGKARANSFKGKRHTEEARQKVSDANMGHCATIQMRQKMSEAAKQRTGEKSTHWKGGVTKANNRGRGGKEYKEWQQAVFERDGYECTRCGSCNNLEADHIHSWLDYPDLRYVISNGKTYCHPCHKYRHGLQNLLDKFSKETQADRKGCLMDRMIATMNLNSIELVMQRGTYLSYWSDETLRKAIPRRKVKWT